MASPRRHRDGESVGADERDGDRYNKHFMCKWFLGKRNSGMICI